MVQPIPEGGMNRDAIPVVARELLGLAKDLPEDGPVVIALFLFEGGLSGMMVYDIAVGGLEPGLRSLGKGDDGVGGVDSVNPGGAKVYRDVLVLALD